MLYRNGWYPPEIRSTNLDSDWFYRKPLNGLVHSLSMIFSALLTGLQTLKQSLLKGITHFAYDSHGPQSPIAQGASVGNMVIWVAVLLSACLMIYYF